MTFPELENIFSQNLYLKHEPDFLKVLMATMVANRMDVESIWLLVLAPPSSGKGMVSTLSKSEEVVMVSTLTANALISGARKQDTYKGKDASLLPKLNGKTMVVKDASTISDMESSAKAQVFSQLRSAYDGDLESKHTGLGEKKVESKFGIIIAGTPDFEHSRTMEGNLGERFINFRPTVECNHRHVWDVISRSNGKRRKRNVLTDAVNEFLIHCGTPEHTIYPDVILHMSIQLATLRAGFKYDRWTKELVASPIIESPYRVGQQFSALFTALSHIDNQKNAMAIVKRMVVDSIPFQRFEALKYVFSSNNKSTKQGFRKMVGWGKNKVNRLIQELLILKVITQGSDDNQDILSISPKFRNLFYLTSRQ